MLDSKPYSQVSYFFKKNTKVIKKNTILFAKVFCNFASRKSSFIGDEFVEISPKSSGRFYFSLDKTNNYPYSVFIPIRRIDSFLERENRELIIQIKQKKVSKESLKQQEKNPFEFEKGKNPLEADFFGTENSFDDLLKGLEKRANQARKSK